MIEKEAVRVLQYQRHDMMNHLQIIHGYMSMGNTEKAKNKMKSWMDELTEERKLFHLQAPKFALWLMQVNHVHTNLRLSYHIETDADLHEMDELLTTHCRRVLASVQKEIDLSSLYTGSLALNENAETSAINVTVTLDGSFNEVKNIETGLADMEDRLFVSVSKTDNGVMCRFSVPCHG